MTYVDPAEFDWQAVRDNSGGRIEVRCPLCGAILFEALTNLQDAESPADIIGDILQGHWEMKLCGAPAPVIDLDREFPQTPKTDDSESETIVDSICKGYDGRYWHVMVYTDEFGDVQREIESLPDALKLPIALLVEQDALDVALYRVGVYKRFQEYLEALPA